MTASSCATPTWAEYDLAAGALEGSVFRMLRQGQRVVFDLDGDGRATSLRLGSEVDMGTPGFPSDQRPRPDRPAGALRPPTTHDIGVEIEP